MVLRSYKRRSPTALGKPLILTESLEDYLEAILVLVTQDPHHHAHTRDIARLLKIKQPSVTNALATLCDYGYVNYLPNYPVTLTPKGEIEAKRVVHRHQVVTAFLHDILQLKQSEASEIACRIEHVITDEMLCRLERLSDEICHAPACELLRQTLKAAFDSELSADPTTPSEE